MKKAGLALIMVNMAASVMAVELEKVDLAALGRMELPAVTVGAIKPGDAPLLFSDSSKNAAQVNWRQSSFTSSDGTGIAVGYSPISLGGSIIASPVRIEVRRSYFRGTEKVRAVVMNYYDSSAMPQGQIQETQTLDLQYDGHGGFYGELSGKVLLSESHIGYGYNFRQELAVVVDGVWLKDPLNGTSNFRFKMSWY